MKDMKQIIVLYNLYIQILSTLSKNNLIGSKYSVNVYCILGRPVARFSVPDRTDEEANAKS